MLLDKHICLKIFEQVNNLPLFKYNNLKVKYLFLSGDHYFKRISLKDTNKLNMEDYGQIKNIHIANSYNNVKLSFLFEVDQSYICSCLPTSMSLRLIYKLVNDTDKFYNDFNYKNNRKIELHIYSERQKNYDEYYSYLTNLIKNITSHLKQLYFINQFYLDSSKSSKSIVYFPRNLDNILFNIDEFKNKSQKHPIIQFVNYDNKCLLIFNQVRKKVIGLSIYSDNVDWFMSILTFLKADKLI
jgi:hypothetical protein